MPTAPPATKVVKGELAFTMDAAAASDVVAAFADPAKKADVEAAFAASLACRATRRPAAVLDGGQRL